MAINRDKRSLLGGEAHHPGGLGCRRLERRAARPRRRGRPHRGRPRRRAPARRSGRRPPQGPVRRPPRRADRFNVLKLLFEKAVVERKAIPFRKPPPRRSTPPSFAPCRARPSARQGATYAAGVPGHQGPRRLSDALLVRFRVAIARRLMRKVCPDCLENCRLTAAEAAQAAVHFRIDEVFDRLRRKSAIGSDARTLRDLTLPRGRGCNQRRGRLSGAPRRLRGARDDHERPTGPHRGPRGRGRGPGGSGGTA